MNTIKFKQLLPLLILTLAVFTACEKEEEDPQDSPTPNLTPNLSGGDGSFWAINTITETETVVGPIQTFLGTAVAIGTSDNYQSFEELGTVNCNSKELTKNSNNSYTFIPGLTDVTGITFAGSVNWEVSGASSFGGFTLDVSDIPFPNVGSIKSAATVNKAEGYTLESDFVSDADSVYFLVGTSLKRVAGNVKSMEFTASDLQDVPNGQLVVQVAAFAIKNKEVQDKSIWFGNETVQSKLITVQ